MSFTRRLVLGALTALLTLVSTTASAAALPTLTGTLKDAKGEPLSGRLTVSARPENLTVGQTLPLVGSGEADAAGQYTVTITDTATVEAIATRQEGRIELDLDFVDIAAFGKILDLHVVGTGPDLRLLTTAELAPRLRGSDADGTIRGGPLTMRGGLSVGLPMRAGRRQLAGFGGFSNTGSRTAVLEEIRPLDVRKGLEILAVQVAGEHRPSPDAAGATDWPNREIYPRGVLRPVRGFRVTPDRGRKGMRGTNIAFVVRAERRGIRGWDYVQVRYRIGERRYRRILALQFRGCFGLRRRMDCRKSGAVLPGIEETIARYDAPAG